MDRERLLLLIGILVFVCMITGFMAHQTIKERFSMENFAASTTARKMKQGACIKNNDPTPTKTELTILNNSENLLDREDMLQPMNGLTAPWDVVKKTNALFEKLDKHNGPNKFYIEKLVVPANNFSTVRNKIKDSLRKVESGLKNKDSRITGDVWVIITQESRLRNTKGEQITFNSARAPSAYGDMIIQLKDKLTDFEKSTIFKVYILYFGVQYNSKTAKFEYLAAGEQDSVCGKSALLGYRSCSPCVFTKCFGQSDQKVEGKQYTDFCGVGNSATNMVVIPTGPNDNNPPRYDCMYLYKISKTSQHVKKFFVKSKKPSASASGN